MNDSDHLWALVLAAGEGRRLRELTTTRAGIAVPKQFCSLEGGASLVQEAIERAAIVAAPERVCAIVAAQHRCFWADRLESLPPENIWVQPQNRGTANGILLPLLAILDRDPHARLLLLPSDHYVREEWRLARALRYAASPPERAWAEIVLLGLKPRSADPQLGYIVPHRESASVHLGIERFVEKPDPLRAQSLLEQGALWNTFIIAADAGALLKLFERRCPLVVAAMREALRAGAAAADADEALIELYETLPELDFSRSILQGQEQHLRVLPVAECGWSDLGTPERVAEALGARPRISQRLVPAVTRHAAFLSLAHQHRRLGHAASAAAGR